MEKKNIAKHAEYYFSICAWPFLHLFTSIGLLITDPLDIFAIRFANYIAGEAALYFAQAERYAGSDEHQLNAIRLIGLVWLLTIVSGGIVNIDYDNVYEALPYLAPTIIVTLGLIDIASKAPVRIEN